MTDAKPPGSKASLHPFLREMLTTLPNPGEEYDYVATLEGPIGTLQDSAVTLSLRYIPDRLVVDSESFMGYARKMASGQWPNLEALAVAIINDFNNELVPRWVRLGLAGQAGGEVFHLATIEDRQPHWKNDDLLRSLKRY